MEKNRTIIESAFNQERAFVYARQGALSICAISSVLVVYQIGAYTARMMGMTGFMEVIIASLLVMVGYIAIDWTLLNALSSFSNLDEGKTKKIPIITLAAFSLVTTIGLSLVSNTILSNDMVGETRLLEYNNKLDETTRQTNAAKLAAFSAIEKAEGKEEEKIKQAKKEADRLLQAAIYSKGDKMAALYKQNNGWARARLAPAVNQAKEEGQKLIEQASNTTEATQATYASVLSYDVAKDTTLSTYLSTLKIAESERLSKKANLTLVLALFSIFCGVLAVIISWALKEHRKDNGQYVVEDHVTPIAKLFSFIGKAIDVMQDLLHDIIFGLPTLARKKNLLKGDDVGK